MESGDELDTLERWRQRDTKTSVTEIPTAIQPHQGRNEIFGVLAIRRYQNWVEWMGIVLYHRSDGGVGF